MCFFLRFVTWFNYNTRQKCMIVWLIIQPLWGVLTIIRYISAFEILQNVMESLWCQKGTFFLSVLHIALHIFPYIWYMESLSVCFFCFTQCRYNLDCNLHFIWFFEGLFVLFFRWTLTLGGNNKGQIQTLSQPKPLTNRQTEKKQKTITCSLLYREEWGNIHFFHVKGYL